MEVDTHAIAVEVVEEVKTVGGFTFDGGVKPQVIAAVEAILNQYL